VKRIERLERQIVPVLKNHDVVRAGLFGSTVRGEARKGSDIDILVEFRGTKSLLDLARLEIELERKLKRKVDVLTYNSVHPLLRETILKEEARVI